MKSNILLIISLIISIANIKAQDSLKSKSLTVQYLFKRGYQFPSPKTRNIPDSLKQWPDVLYYNTVYRAKRFGTPTIPFSFTKVEYKDGSIEVSPTISIGYGYAWFTGDFIFNENDKIIVDPKFFYGLIGNIGIQSNFSLKNLANFFLGGFIGMGAYSLFAGYDFVAQGPTIGIGTRIDLYTLKQDLLKPYGKIRELRKHKSFAFKILNE